MGWIRKHAWKLMVTAIVLFIGGFIAPAVLRYVFGLNLGGGRARRSIAFVNEQKITRDDFQQALDRKQKQYRSNNPGQISDEQLDELRQEAFEQVVNRLIMQDIISREKAGATDRQIRQMVMQQFRDKNGRVNKKRMNQYLSRISSKKRAKIANQQRVQLETMRMMQWIEDQIGFSQVERNELIEEGLTEVGLLGILTDPREFVSDTNIRRYYDSNTEDFMAPPKVYLRQIYLTSGDTTLPRRKRLEVLKEDVDTIRRRFKAGDSFSELAKTYSADTETASRGGLKGWVTPEDLPDEVAKTAFRTDTGTLSKLVKTDRGYYLLYVEKGPKQSPKPLKHVEPKIRDLILTDTHWTQARVQTKSLRNSILNANDVKKRFQEIAFVKSHSEATSDESGRYGWVPVEYFAPSIHGSPEWKPELVENNLLKPKISEALSKLQPGDLSKPVKSDVGYHLLYATDRRPARMNAVSDTDIQTITRTVQQSKTNSFAESWLKKRRKKAWIELKARKSRIGEIPPWVDELPE